MVGIRRGPFLTSLTAIIAVTFVVQSSYAQVRAYRGSSALSRFGTVGYSGVYGGGNLYREALGRGTQPNAVNAGNYVGQGLGPAALSAQRRRVDPLEALRPPPLGVRNTFANPLNTGLYMGSRRTMRDYTGQNTWGHPNNRPVSTGYEPGALYMSIRAPQALLEKNAFYAPVRDANKGGSIRDDLTNLTLRNMPDEVPTRMDTTLLRPSYAEMMADRLQAEHSKRLEDAWVHFSEGRLQQAANTFRTLTNWRDRELEPTLGLLFTELLSEQYATAAATARRLVVGSAGQRSVTPGAEAQRVNPFRCALDLRRRNPSRPDWPPSAASAPAEPSSSNADAAWSETKLANMLRELGVASQSGDSPAISAAYAFMLWYADQPREARRVAEEVRTKYTDTPFARMASDIGEAMASKPVGQPTAAATP